MALARMNIPIAAATRLFQGWAVRRHPPNPVEVVLDQRRVYILPTASGWLFAILLLVMFLAATNYGVSLGFLFTFLLAGFGAVSMWHTHRNLLDLRLLRPSVENTFQGQPARFLIKVLNKEQRKRFALAATAGSQFHTCTTDLEPMAAGQFEVSILGEHRGLLPLGRVKVYTRYPTGLFQAWTWVDFGCDCLVYPRPAGHRNLPLGAAHDGKGKSGLGQDPEDFKSLRDYSAGDSPRHVAWKAAARSEVLLTKEFQGENDGRVWFDWEHTPGLDAEARLSQLCLWVLSGEGTGLKYGLALPGIRIPPNRGLSHRDRCLEALAMFRS